MEEVFFRRYFSEKTGLLLCGCGEAWEILVKLWLHVLWFGAQRTNVLCVCVCEGLCVCVFVCVCVIVFWNTSFHPCMKKFLICPHISLPLFVGSVTCLWTLMFFCWFVDCWLIDAWSVSLPSLRSYRSTS